MSATTRWKDNETTNIDRAIELLVDSVEMMIANQKQDVKIGRLKKFLMRIRKSLCLETKLNTI